MIYKTLSLGFLIFCLFTVSVFSIGKFSLTTEEETLLKYKNEITQAAKQIGISPRIIASIIYAEQKLNVKLGEDILDYVFAKSGYNASLGIAQVKINTAFWIEKQVHNPGGQFYLGKYFENQIPLSVDLEEVIDKLKNPMINILYASCYIAMIKNLWEPIFELSSLESISVGIIASIYSLGIIDSENKIRKPHIDAKMNNFGQTAQEFYQSFSLRNHFN